MCIECSICKNTVCSIEVIIGFHTVNSERDDIKLCLSIIHIRKGSLIKIKTLSLIYSIINFESEIKILIVTYWEQNVKFHEIALVVSELQTQIKCFVLTTIHIFERRRICLQRASGISLYECIIVINFVGRRIETTSSTRIQSCILLTCEAATILSTSRTSIAAMFATISISLLSQGRVETCETTTTCTSHRKTTAACLNSKIHKPP